MYRAFEIYIDVDTKEGQTKVVHLRIGIKGQHKRISINPDAVTSADFIIVEYAIEVALKQARRTIDKLLDDR